MVQRTGGFRRKTRRLFKKNVRAKGKVSISKYLQKYEVGDKVHLKAESAVQKGMYYPRYHGKQGIVSRKQGFCYEVTIKDFRKEKKLIVHPVHLVKAK